MTSAQCNFYHRLAGEFSNLESKALLLAQGGRGSVAEIQRQQDELLHGVAHLAEKLGLDAEAAQWKAATHD